MAPVKPTDMVLKVNLNCPYCYKKVKRILGEMPQVSNQVFDEKQGTVNIAVCCNSEMVREKIAKKGGKTVQEIKIKEPPKPKPKEEAKSTDNKPKGEDKPKEEAKSTDNKPKGDDKPKGGDNATKTDKPKGGDNATKTDKPKEAPVPVAAVVPLPVPVAAPVPVPVAAPAPVPVLLPPVAAPAPILQPAAMTVQAPMGYPYYMPAYGGYHPGSAEPSYESGHWKPVPVSDNYGYYGYDQGDASYKQGYNDTNRDHYFNEENPSACTIM